MNIERPTSNVEWKNRNRRLQIEKLDTFNTKRRIIMKKTIYFTMVVLLSMALIGSVSAEEKVKPDNQNAVIESSFDQTSTSVAKLSKSTSRSLLPKFDIEIDEYNPGLCNHLKKICRDASPPDDSGICEYFTEEYCPGDF